MSRGREIVWLWSFLRETGTLWLSDIPSGMVGRETDKGIDRACEAGHVVVVIAVVQNIEDKSLKLFQVGCVERRHAY